MTLNDFVDITEVEIRRFNKWYREERVKTPERFPLKMDHTEWIEQFLVWQTQLDDTIHQTI